jgi:hypothetical protein
VSGGDNADAELDWADAVIVIRQPQYKPFSCKAHEENANDFVDLVAEL